MPKSPNAQDLETCIDVLNALVADSVTLTELPTETRIALLVAAGKLSRPTRQEERKRRRDRTRLKKQRIDDFERSIRAKTGIRSARTASVFEAPPKLIPIAPEPCSTNSTHTPRIEHTETINASHGAHHAPVSIATLIKPKACYVCKADFTQLHFFYDAMCPTCADFNYAKRFQTAPLHGKIALITGSRLKIGYQASLMMLRAGAQVIATTRFPIDSALRYSKEKDFSEWQNRLHIYGLDLRHTPSVELFAAYVEKTYPRLDILINNAAQTVRRPPGFYAHLMQSESLSIDDLSSDVQPLLRPFVSFKATLAHEGDTRHTLSSSATHAHISSEQVVGWNVPTLGIGISHSAALSQIPYTHDRGLRVDEIFPEGKLDADLQQVDLRETNSWRLNLGDIPTAEMIELQLVNAIAPFVLCNKLSTMMKRDNTGQKHIVNVSAMEGKFHRYTKTTRHPHTNMAKAALNMLTHTSAKDLETYGIYMNAVDTGWVTDEDPHAISRRKQTELDFEPPLDIVDGAARICDPFFHGILTGTHWCGQFLKDYAPVDW